VEAEVGGWHARHGGDARSRAPRRAPRLTAAPQAVVDEILLYEANESPSGLQARICLQLKGVPFRRLAVRFGGLRALGRVDALGEIPVLVQGTEVVAGARSIAHHLEERHPDPGLIPDDAAARAYVLLLEDWADEALGVLVGALRWLDPDNRSAAQAQRGWLRPLVGRILARRAWRRYAAASWTPESLELVRGRVRDSLDLVAELLDGKPFLLGRHPTLADVAVFAQLAALSRCREGGFIADAPAVDAWLRRLGAVPPIAAALSP
jgi:glutathione S-transferase